MSFADSFEDAPAVLVDLFGCRRAGTVRRFQGDGWPAKFWMPDGTGFELVRPGEIPEYREMANSQPAEQG